MTKQYVWYIAYGSNLLMERFLCYIKGGSFRGNSKIYEGCTDTSLPLKDKPFLVPYELYFGNESGSWDGSGVAFIDTDKPGIALGRAYLITYEQFLEIQHQEGTSPRWYGRIVELASSVGDIPHMTFTSEHRRPDNMPNNNYLDILLEGLRETYPQLRLFWGASITEE